MKKNTSVMALIIIYENNEKKPKNIYRVLRCIVYTITDNYVCIDHLSCQSKNLSAISCDPKFKDTCFNILLGIGIPELLLNLVSCNTFTKKKINCDIKLPKLSEWNYLTKRFSIIEQDKKLFILLPNYMKLWINLINKLDTDYVIVKNKAISDVSNIIKQFHIQKKYAYNLQTRLL